jgi:hypothetical protein
MAWQLRQRGPASAARYRAWLKLKEDPMNQNVDRVMRILHALFVTTASLWLLAACADKQQEPARQAIAEIEAAVTAAGNEPAKYVPNRLGDVTEQLAMLKTRFEQEDYAGVLQEAPAALAAAEALQSQAAARKAELHALLQHEWDTMLVEVPAEIELVRTQIAQLSGRKQLPDGVTAAILEAAGAAITDAEALWQRAETAHAAGNPEESVTLANQARDRLRSLERVLGKPSGPAGVK